MNKTKICCLLSIILFSNVVYARQWNDTLARIEKIFSRYKSEAPGAQLTISRNGQSIYSRAWGMADLEHAVPLTTTSIIEAGSVSKQFTAAAILLLEQEGKLSLQDDVRKYIPELPDYGTVITLQQMMQHTSGLKDWGAIAAISGWPRTTKTYNNDDALYIITRQKTLNNKPGDEYIYSNSNYNLFAIIVQRVSGMSLADYSAAKIFGPAAMTHTEWRSNFKKIVPNRAIAYSRGGTGHLTNMPNEYVYGNGGLLTTTEDLVKWNEYYQTGKLGTPSLLSRQITSSRLNNGVMHDYAAGLEISNYNGWNLITHDGATAGYRSSLDYFPEHHLSIAWLSNTSEFDILPFNIIDSIRSIFLTLKPGTQNEVRIDFNVPLTKLESYTGWYKNPRSGGALRLFTRNGKLHASRIGELKPTAENIFFIGNSANNFTISGQKQKELLYISATKDSIYFSREDSAMINDQVLQQYTGEYYSEEAETKIIMKMKNSRLILFQYPKTEITLSPTFKDGFDSPAGSLLFERDSKKKIKGFKMSISRARNVQFMKVRS